MLSCGQVARAFGVDSRTVTRWTNDGVLPCIRTPGGHRRYKAADVAALMSQPYTPRPSGLPTLAAQQSAAQSQSVPPSHTSAVDSARDEYA
jgi:excisionase family DNA binding protein